MQSQSHTLNEALDIQGTVQIIKLYVYFKTCLLTHVYIFQLLIALLQHVEFSKDIQSSGVTFIFWTLELLCNVLVLASKITRAQQNHVRSHITVDSASPQHLLQSISIFFTILKMWVRNSLFLKIHTY